MTSEGPPPGFQPDSTLFPFESRWFESRVGPVHYIDEGQGPPILFLHGNPTWSFLYRGIVVRLRKRFRCVALDYPGFGLSEAPPDYGFTPGEHAGITTALVEHLGLENLTIMGQDWGGPIGMRVALNQRKRMRALVMGNTWYWPLDALHMRAFSMVMGSGFMQSMILKRNVFVEKVIPMGTKHPVPHEVMEHYRGPTDTPQRRAGSAEFPKQLLSAAAWLGTLSDQVPDALGDLPVLLTWGVHDMAFTTRFIDRFRQDFQSVKVLRLDAKHYIQEDAPAEISEALGGFLA